MRYLRRLILLAAAIVLAAAAYSAVAVLTTHDLTLKAQLSGEPELTFSNEGIVELISWNEQEITFAAVSEGETDIQICSGGWEQTFFVRSCPGGILLQASTGCFNGWRSVLGAVTLALILLAAASVCCAVRQLRAELYSDASPLLVAISLILNVFILLWVFAKLAGISLCGWLAARKEPAPDKDYILILGCMLSRKGGLTPLLPAVWTAR